MSDIAAVIWTITIVVASFLYVRFKNAEGEPANIKYELAKDAIDKIKDWGIWLTSLQTAAIGALGLIVSGENYQPDDYEKVTAFFSLVFFATSILLSTWILSSLPSIIMRLDTSTEGSTTNDIYHMDIYSFISIKLGPMTGLKHFLFIVGVVFFTSFIYHRFTEHRGKTSFIKKENLSYNCTTHT